jgi:DNA-binding beta-propeller fold protein YncE
LNIETNEVSTLGGFAYEFAVFDGPLSQARFEGPRGCGVAPNQDGLLVADSATLRWIDFAQSTVTTWIGRSGETGNQDGTQSEARLGYLTHDLLWAPSGDYAILSDRSNDRLRLFVRRTQTLHAFGPLKEGDQNITLDGPGGLALTPNGDLLIADTFSGRVVQVNLSDLNLEDQIARFEENEDQEDDQGEGFTLNLELLEAEVISNGLSDPQGIATDGQKAWVAGFNGEVVEVDLDTGDARPVVLNLDQHKEPPLGGAFAPLVFDSMRSVLYYLDLDTESVRQITPQTGVVKTLVGPKNPLGDQDGSLNAARFGVLYDGVGTDQGWFVTDPEYGKVKQIILEGDQSGVTTIISSPQTARSLPLPPERIQGQSPVALAYDRQNQHLYIADITEHVIRRYHLETQMLEIVMGAVDESGNQDGIGLEARLNQPFGLDFADDGLLYIADAGNQAIRSFNPNTQEVLTIAQGPVESFDVFKHQNGNIYMVDGNTPVLFQVNGTRFDPIIGNPEEMGPGDGVGGLFASPTSLTRHPQGGILVSDASNHRIRLVDVDTQSIDTWVGQFTRHGGWGHREAIPWEEIRLQSPNAVALFNTQAIILNETGVLLLEDPRLDLEENP